MKLKNKNIAPKEQNLDLDKPSRVELFNDGYIRAEYWEKDGQLHRENGPAEIHYYTNGAVWMERYYKNGKLHNTEDAAIQEYFDDGEWKSYAYYQNGVQLDPRTFGPVRPEEASDLLQFDGHLISPDDIGAQDWDDKKWEAFKAQPNLQGKLDAINPDDVYGYDPDDGMSLSQMKMFMLADEFSKNYDQVMLNREAWSYTDDLNEYIMEYAKNPDAFPSLKGTEYEEMAIEARSAILEAEDIIQNGACIVLNQKDERGGNYYEMLRVSFGSGERNMSVDVSYECNKPYAEKDCVISRSDYGVPSHNELLGLAYADLEEEIGVSQNDLFLMSEHEMNVLHIHADPVEALGDNYDAGKNKEAQFEFVRMFNEDKEAQVHGRTI